MQSKSGARPSYTVTEERYDEKPKFSGVYRGMLILFRGRVWSACVGSGKTAWFWAETGQRGRKLS